MDFYLPKDWIAIRLQTVLKLSSGRDLTQEEYSNDIIGIPYITGASNFNKESISTNRYTKYPQVVVNEGDLLITCKGTIGEIAYCPYKEAHIARQIMAIKNIFNLNSKYITICIKYYLSKIKSSAKGLIPGIAREDLLNLIIPLPSMKEQLRIVKKVEEYDSYLETLNENKQDLLESINSLKSKILDLAIRGKLVPQDPNDEPADVLLERIRKEKEELIKQGKIKRDKKESIIFKGDDNSYYEQFEKNTEKFDEEIPFSIPDSWQWARLGSYTQKITDYVASGSFATLRENVPVLKNKDYAIMVKTADFSNNFTQNLTYTTEHGYNYLENSNLFGGELILSNIGSIGKVFIVPKLNQKMTLAPNTVMIKLLNEEHRDYVYNFLLSPFGYAQLLKISGGTGIAKFNKTDLKTLLLPIPPIQEQDRIIKQINNLFDLLSEVENSIK